MVTATAHTNIALIKYWGKADATLNLPTTSSLSLTLDDFYTTTTVSRADKDTFTLNGAPADGTRVFQFLDMLRGELGDFGGVTIDSVNHVPTSAGLASSASAFAALTGAATRELGLDLDTATLSRLARRGSGSASRSFFADFALWHAGHDDASSFAESLALPADDIAMLVVQVSAAKKSIGSTLGMQRAQTAPTYADWVAKSAAQLNDIQRALANADLTKAGEIAEVNALAMHHLNETAREPFTYFTAETRALIAFVQQLRQQGVLAFVTIDAGPNVKIITDRTTVPTLQTALKQAFPALPVTAAYPGGGITYA